MADIWNAFLDEGDAYDAFPRIDDNGEGEIIVDPAPLPDELSLEFGEMLYQLRAALDSLIYEVAIIDSGEDPPPDADKLEFPFRSTPEKFEQVAWKLGPLTEQHQIMVESIQPYRADESEGQRLIVPPLELLNDLARKDRHRGLHVVGSWGANKNPLLDLPPGCSIDWLASTADGLLEHEAVVARFKVRGWRRGMELVANPNFTIDIAVSDAPPPRHDSDTLNQRVKEMIVTVSYVIEGFEKTLH